MCSKCDEEEEEEELSQSIILLHHYLHDDDIVYTKRRVFDWSNILHNAFLLPGLILHSESNMAGDTQS